MNNKILVIAGMHRSGTSLISQWLYRCGLNLGETLLGAGVGNTDGHFEDMDFLRFHEDTLEANHGSRAGYIHESVKQLSHYQKEKLKGIISFKSQVNEQWGWKEPRTCLFLDHYRELIPKAYYLIIVRDFNATVSSLIQRDLKNLDIKYKSKNFISRFVWKSIRRGRMLRQCYLTRSEFYLNVWITYNEALLKNIRSLKDDQFIVTDHNLLSETNTTLFDKLVNSWHFSLKYANFSHIYDQKMLSRVVKIEEFIADKMLLEKARNLEQDLRQYLHHN